MRTFASIGILLCIAILLAWFLWPHTAIEKVGALGDTLVVDQPIIDTQTIDLVAVSQTISASSTPIEKKAFLDALKATTSLKKIDIKSDELVKVGPIAQEAVITGKDSVQIQITDIQKIDGGIAVFAKAWTAKGDPIGFGADGTVETERFRVFNPPVLVSDPLGEVNNDFVDRFGVTTTMRYTYDPKRAIEQVIADNVRIVGKTGTKIVPGSVGNTTDTFFPNANVETTSVDGYIKQGGSWIDTWTNTRNSATPFTANDSGASGEMAETFAYTTSGNWNELLRSMYLFDTSALPDTDTISSATFSLNIASKGDIGAALTVALVTSSPTSNTALATGDWPISTKFGANRLATDLTVAGVTTGAYNDWTLNATGIANVSLTGISKFGVLLGQDLDNSTPTWSASAYGHITGAYADTAGTASDPKLVVVHTAAGGTTPFSTATILE